MVKSELPDTCSVKELAKVLGIDEPYNARVLGDRIEFHLRTRVLVYPDDSQPDACSGAHVSSLDPERMSRADLVQLAAELNIRGRSAMSKAELIRALGDQQINKSTNQQINKSANQQINKSANQQINKSANRQINESANQQNS